MSILLAQTFVVPLQFQDTIVVESGYLFYTCNVGNYKAISFPVSINVFRVLQHPVERPGRVWLCRFCEVYFALDLLRLLIHLKSSIVV